MERQIYGKVENALYYFNVILGRETVLPTVLEVKEYTLEPFRHRLTMLNKVGRLNEIAKWSGVTSNLIGWGFAIYYVFPLLTIR